MNVLTLSNGLRVVYRQTPGNPVSAAHLFFTQGTASEADDQRGVTTLMWSLLTKGSKRRSARKLAEDMEGIGAHMSGGASHDNSHASCHAIADYFPAALEMFAEALFNPTYLPEEIDKEKAALLAAIEAKKESIFSVAQDETYARLFGGHPYAVPTIGEKETLAAASRDAVVRRHEAIVVPNETVLSIASSLPYKSALPIVKRFFGSEIWPKKSKAPKHAMKAPPSISSQKVKKEHPFEQAYLMIGFPVMPISSADYVPAKLLAIALGGGMSSRLFQSLREERALAYDVGAFLAGRRKGSAFIIYMGLQAAKLQEAKKQIEVEIERIRREKMTQAELENVKNYFKGSFILDHQTNSQRAYYIGWSLCSGKSLNYDKEFLRAIERVTPASLQKVARKALDGSSVTVEIIPKSVAAVVA